MAEADIGCSLAEAAESDSYTAYLEEAASRAGPALHVVYINTSLRTKAQAHAIVPTITCTSGNVVQTILQVCISSSVCEDCVIQSSHFSWWAAEFASASCVLLLFRCASKPCL